MTAVMTQPLTIVSGLPRSGTSMMMRMLDKGGMPVIIDGERVADDDNPGGYYEFEPVKKTKEDPSWLEGSEGKVVKMIYRLIYDLPSDRKYKVLFMRRQLEEILASQKIMLQRNGHEADVVPDEQIATLFKSEIERFLEWEAEQEHIDMLTVDYNRIQASPNEVVAEINEFIGGTLDEQAMVAIVDPKLYRNRAK